MSGTAAPGRDLRAELVHREFRGWFEAQSWPSSFDEDDMHFAFEAGMDAQAELAAQLIAAEADL